MSFWGSALHRLLLHLVEVVVMMVLVVVVLLLLSLLLLLLQTEGAMFGRDLGREQRTDIHLRACHYAADATLRGEVTGKRAAHDKNRTKYRPPSSGTFNAKRVIRQIGYVRRQVSLDASQRRGQSPVSQRWPHGKGRRWLQMVASRIAG